MQIFYNNIRFAPCVFTIERPGNGGGRMNHCPGGRAGMDQLIVILLRLQRIENAA